MPPLASCSWACYWWKRPADVDRTKSAWVRPWQTAAWRVWCWECDCCYPGDSRIVEIETRALGQEPEREPERKGPNWSQLQQHLEYRPTMTGPWPAAASYPAAGVAAEETSHWPCTTLSWRPRPWVVEAAELIGVAE